MLQTTVNDVSQRLSEERKSFLEMSVKFNDEARLHSLAELRVHELEEQVKTAHAEISLLSDRLRKDLEEERMSKIQLEKGYHKEIQLFKEREQLLEHRVREIERNRDELRLEASSLQDALGQEKNKVKSLEGKKKEERFNDRTNAT